MTQLRAYRVSRANAVSVATLIMAILQTLELILQHSSPWQECHWVISIAMQVYVCCPQLQHPAACAHYYCCSSRMKCMSSRLPMYLQVT